jgi:hypothetical protein
VREGRFLEAVGAAQERVAPRPLYVVVDPSDIQQYPRLLAALRGAGAQVVVSNPAVAILRPPPLRPEP